ncbi:hypothetical protein PV328_007826 [Microctonus aethiopoides]|uniref:Myb/SANT-like DNA-binding domain-containing protein n=1 Tax=Microctonus aethiopoides TaxID=144406 RepID=A0AA39CAF6_9HYME|nr:hypothetical protein PV328_007826 [Microctonus aethiopoides]
MESEYIIFMNVENAENLEAVNHNSVDDGSIDESIKSKNEDSAFKWPHGAILLLIDEYQKRQTDFSSGKFSHKKLWIQISGVLRAHGHNITGPQCQSKLSGMKKTYKKIKDHNDKSGNSAKKWPCTTVSLTNEITKNE